MWRPWHRRTPSSRPCLTVRARRTLCTRRLRRHHVGRHEDEQSAVLRADSETGRSRVRLRALTRRLNDEEDVYPGGKCATENEKGGSNGLFFRLGDEDIAQDTCRREDHVSKDGKRRNGPQEQSTQEESHGSIDGEELRQRFTVGVFFVSSFCQSQTQNESIPTPGSLLGYPSRRTHILFTIKT